MHIVVYRFTPKPGQDQAFVASWKTVTEGIRKHRGSLGSRLHRDQNGDWIAYAQWPSKAVAARKVDVPEKHQANLRTLFSLLEKTEVLHEMDVVEDLLARPS